MNVNRVILLLLFLLAFAPALVSAGGRVAVIVNWMNKQPITQEDVKNIYSDNTITWDNGQKILAYNLPVYHPAREKFSQYVLGLSAQDAAAAESNRRITNMSRNPQRTKNEGVVMIHGKRKNHFIGYVPEETLDNSKPLRVLFYID